MDDAELERAAAETLKIFEDSLRESELLGEAVIMDKQQIVDLDRKRNSNREALAELKKMQPKVEDIAHETKLWFCTGSLFVKLPQNAATEIIRSDQKNLTETVNKLQNDLKPKIQRIQEIERIANPRANQREEVSANSFHIKPMTRRDMM